MGQTQSAAAASVPGVMAEGSNTHTVCHNTEAVVSASAVASTSQRVGRHRSCGRDVQAASIAADAPSVCAPTPTSTTAITMISCAASTGSAPIATSLFSQAVATSDQRTCSTAQRKSKQETNTRPATSALPPPAAGVRAAVLTADSPPAVAVSSGSPDAVAFRWSRSTDDDKSPVSATEAVPISALTPSAVDSASTSSIRGQQPGPVPLRAPRPRRPAYRRHPSPYPGREGFASVRAAARVLAGLDGDGIVASPVQARAGSDIMVLSGSVQGAVGEGAISAGGADCEEGVSKALKSEKVLLGQAPRCPQALDSSTTANTSAHTPACQVPLPGKPLKSCIRASTGTLRAQPQPSQQQVGEDLLNAQAAIARLQSALANVEAVLRAHAPGLAVPAVSSSMMVGGVSSNSSSNSGDAAAFVVRVQRLERELGVALAHAREARAQVAEAAGPGEAGDKTRRGVGGVVDALERGVEE
ncbi:hypothetical protein HK405_003413, partial [Cladochytrium tenue]